MFNPIFFAGNRGLLAKLVAYYTFNSVTTESTGLSPNGTGFGIDYVAGKTGNAVRFNGATDRVDVTDNNNFSFTDGVNDIPFSINVWIYFTAFTAIAGNWIINKRNAVSGGDEWQIHRSTADGKIYFTKFDKVSNTISQAISTSSFSSSLNTWYNITFTDDGSKTVAGLKIYVNGVLQTTASAGSGTYTGMPNGTSLTRFGLNSWNLTTFECAHNGYLEDVGIWKGRVLNQTEITYLYNSGNGRTYPL
jgi:hypothetical protein